MSKATATPQSGLKRHPELLRALHAEWRKLSPNLAAPSEEMTERELRIWWTNEKLGAVNSESRIASWGELKPGEAKFLIKCMREESGDGPAYRARMIAQLAQELFGAPWDRMLSDRLRARFQKYRADELTPREAHSEIEELLSRIARRDGCEIEEVRRRLSRPSEQRIANNE